MARVERPLVVRGVASVAAPLLIALLAEVASAQREVWRVEGRVHAERFGDAIALLPDRTGDGVPELLIGAPPQPWNAVSYDRGMVRVLSGSDLALLLEIGGEPFRTRQSHEQDLFGVAVAAAGDADGDGIDDFLVGNPNSVVVELLSGADGHLLASCAGAAPSLFGSSLADLGDVDGDGRRDFAVGAPEERGSTNRRGVVTVFSGATGVALHRRETLTDRTGMGSRDRIAALPDLDGDGANDLGVIDVQRVGTVSTSLVRVLSGRSGTVLLDVPFDQGARANFTLVAIAPIGDFDLDGTPDLVVGGLPANSANPCAAFLVSGANGSPILRVDGNGNAYWIAVGSAGDLDGDGRDELMVGCDDSSARSSRLRLFRGSDGALLQESVEPGLRQYGRAFAGGVDFDGDGTLDVAIGIPDLTDPAFAGANGYTCGALDTWSWSAGMQLHRRIGLVEQRPIGAMVASIDDVDGDGCTDVIHPVCPPLVGNFHQSVQLRSGRDGSLLADHPVLNGRISALAALPDLDGDAIGDYAVAVDDGIGVVELRSSATGALIRVCVVPAYVHRFGSELAVGVDAGGGVQLAVGSPYSQWRDEGTADLFDATTGLHRFRFVGEFEFSQCGNAVVFLGDVDGDGTGDWLIGTPGDSTATGNAGRATLVSGSDGTTIVELSRGVGLDAFGWAAAAIGDQDGDGFGDVAIGAPHAGSTYEGEVCIYSGRTWTPMTVVVGSSAVQQLGSFLAAPGDVNRDGIEEWAAGGWTQDPIELRSGATGTTIARLPRGARFAPKEQRGSATGDRIHDVMQVLETSHVGTWPGGTVALFEMAELFLDVEPPTAQQGDLVVATTRGGVPTLPAALELVAMNGVAIHALIDVGVFDSIGERALSDVIPPGLAGNVLELRAWALDAHGKLVESTVATLTLQ